VRFLSISANNLDEFFMVRVAGLKAQVREGITTQPGWADAVAEQLARIGEAVVATRQRPAGDLARIARRAGRRRHRAGRWPPTVTKTERIWLEDISSTHIFPLLTPLAIDPAHPFPFIPNLGFTDRAAAGAGLRRQGR
jgi:polyphosphate kinase